ncbi:MAG: hypothetical protein JWO99_207 [Candidatus Saccharibacteria bacterium]|nr:hypothetical protein [Candidatus Saccharibacteria bacterium]
MPNVILGRIEMLADLHERAVDGDLKRHLAVIYAEEVRFTDEVAAENARRDTLLAFELDNLVYNMAQRCKARGVKDRTERYIWLHTLKFEDSFLDLSDRDQKDARVREYFDPLLVLCDGDKKTLLDAYIKALDRYFPMGRSDRTWRPELRKVDFTPRRKTDTRTKTYTIVHNWNHV